MTLAPSAHMLGISIIGSILTWAAIAPGVLG